MTKSFLNLRRNGFGRTSVGLESGTIVSFGRYTYTIRTENYKMQCGLLPGNTTGISENLGQYMSKIRKSAQDQACMVRLPGICKFRTDTTVLAHWNGYGVGGKNPDFMGAYCCADCHDVIDGRVKTDLSNDKIKLYFAEGIFRTQQLLYHGGLITTKGSE